MKDDDFSQHEATVTLKFSTAGVSALARILQNSAAMSVSEALETAVLFQDTAMITSQTGGEVIIRQKNGEEVIFSGDDLPAPDPLI